MQHDSGRGGRRKRSVLKHYFATYSLAVVCVCLLVYGVSVVLFTRQYRINTLENHLQRCQRLQNDMNAEMMRLQEIATHIGSNLLLTATQLNNSYDYYLAVQELKKYQIASRYVDEILLIYPEDTLAYAITSIATYRSDTLDAYFGISAAQLAQWGERMKPMMIWTRADANRISREKLYYLVSLYRPVNRGKGIVLYSLDVEGIRRTMLSSLDVSEGAVFLLSEEGRPILSAHTTRSQVREEDIEQYLTHFVNGQSVYQDRSVTCVYRASGLYGGFLTIIQQGGAEAAFQRTQALLAGLLLGLLMLGQAIAWALARHAYRPIRTLTETVHRTQEAGSGVFQPDMNEFQYIARAFEVTRMEKQALISNVLSKSRTQIEDVLLSLLRGNHHVVEKNYLLETLGMTLNLPRYRLVLILLDRYREYQASVDADDCDRTKSALAELLQKHIGRRVFVYCTESTDGSRLIALCNYGDAVTDEDFAEASRRMQEEIAATLDVTVTVVLGGAYADLSQTARQRQILFDAARHRLIVGWNALIYADHIPLEPTNQSSPYSEYDLYLCYKTGECQKVAFMLAEIFDRSTRAMTAAMAIVEYHKVLGVMYKVNSECRNPDALKQCLQAALAFEPETMEDLLQCLSEVTRMLCASVMGDREGRSDSLKKQICAYIDARYSDSVLTQEEIAGAMQVTVSYLNRYFKAQTGQSLASYIDALRMEEARRLLRETKMTVKDIVAQVGYGNTNHFIRKFRTTYQMTPIQFRNLLAPSEADGAESDK